MDHKTWADVMDDALHYIAGAVLIGIVAAFSWEKIALDPFLVALLVAAAAAVGIKISNSK